ncbi:hypothetical protein [Methanobrevibacter sp.]|uniref:hypothetical protein n=1 Tax=Methanobrevibacter sp. TaxID=66852 RepID=UPI00388E912A
MTKVMKDLVTWLKQWFYTESEVDTITGSLQTQINNKADTTTVSALATTVDGKADSSHTHTAGQVKDSTAYSNLGTSANATQATINSAINTKIGALTDVDLLKVVTTLPTASSSTMNALYLVAKATTSTNDGYDIYITVKSGSNYSWEKVDDASLSLGDYAKLTDVPVANDTASNIKMNGSQNAGSLSTFAKADHVHPTDTSRAASDHQHGSITNDGKVGSSANKPLITGTGGLVSAGSFEGTATNIKMNGTQAVGSRNTFARGDHVHPSDTTKSDKSETIDITKIELIDKGETNEGCIVFETIS